MIGESSNLSFGISHAYCNAYDAFLPLNFAYHISASRNAVECLAKGDSLQAPSFASLALA
jgi:hypothetical protein